MKKHPLLLIIILLLIPLCVSPLGTLYITKEISDKSKENNCCKVDMSHKTDSSRARTGFHHLLVFKFEDRIEIFAMLPFAASVEIADQAGCHIYKGRHSLKPSEKITISTNNLETGEYSVNVILTDNDYYSGSFSID